MRGNKPSFNPRLISSTEPGSTWYCRIAACILFSSLCPAPGVRPGVRRAGSRLASSCTCLDQETKNPVTAEEEPVQPQAALWESWGAAVASIHRIAEKMYSRKPIFSRSHPYTLPVQSRVCPLIGIGYFHKM